MVRKQRQLGRFKRSAICRIERAKKLFLTYALIVFSASAFGQNISFTDAGLKSYLIEQLCVDTLNTFWGTGHVDVDLNNDNEIQLTEALSVEQLIFDDFGSNYSILSVQDLMHFENLKWLKIVHLDSIYEISNLGLDSLKQLWISSNLGLKIIDLSDLIHLTESLKIEGQSNIEYLNIRNGSAPDHFSLFYSEHIQYACVDSISFEFNYVAGMMSSGTPNVDDCDFILHTNYISEQHDLVTIFPNPTDGKVTLKSDFTIDEICIFNLVGEIVFQTKNCSNLMSISHLTPGLYFYAIRVQGELLPAQSLILE